MYQTIRSATSERLAVRGLCYHFHRWGSSDAPPVLLLHGWMDCGASFQFLVDHLPQGWHLIAPDWRGFGDSEWAQGGYYFPEYLADLDIIIDHFSPNAGVALVGHSMGGNIASLYAGIRPQRVSRLVSLEGFGLPPTRPEQAPTRYRSWMDQQREDWTPRHYPNFDALARKLSKNNPRLGDDRAAFVARCWARESEGKQIVLRADPRHRTRNPILYRLEESRACWTQTQAQTLWITGSASPFAKMHGAVMDANRRCYRELREAVIPDAGHMLHHDQPERLAEALIEFLS
ncbi:MAG: alpha/beta hydrolase [Pseudomonadota bacterium]|nr:alpha/beta hydrolase [Pseudomonadota bacterium]